MPRNPYVVLGVQAQSLCDGCTCDKPWATSHLCTRVILGRFPCPLDEVGAAEEDVKKAYRTLALQCHPDKRPPEARYAWLSLDTRMAEPPNWVFPTLFRFDRPKGSLQQTRHSFLVCAQQRRDLEHQTFRD